MSANSGLSRNARGCSFGAVGLGAVLGPWGKQGGLLAGSGAQPGILGHYGEV